MRNPAPCTALLVQMRSGNEQLGSQHMSALRAFTGAHLVGLDNRIQQIFHRACQVLYAFAWG